MPWRPDVWAMCSWPGERLSINGVRLQAGDGALLRDEEAVRIDNGDDAEILLFDLPSG